MQKIKNYTLGYDLGNKTVASTAINSDFNIIIHPGIEIPGFLINHAL